MTKNRSNFLHLSLLLWVSLLVNSAQADTPAPEWIWHDNHGAKAADNEVRYFRKTFNVDGRVSKAALTATGDDEIVVYVNGHQVVESTQWEKAARVDVTRQLRSGDNLIAIRGKNRAGEAAIIAMLELT